MTDRIALPGSERAPVEARVIGPPDKPEITVSVVLEDDVDNVAPLRDFANEHALALEDDGKTRVVKLTGRPGDLEAAFGVELDLVEHPELGVFRRRQGAIVVPADVAPLVHAVLGLDDRPAARLHLRMSPRAGAEHSWNPSDLAKFYGFPDDVDGTGRMVGIVELGGGFNQADLASAWRLYGLSKTPRVDFASVDGGKNKPDGPNGADGEVYLDIEVVGAAAPGAHQVVYFAPNTDAGFVDAVAQAEAEGCEIVSISWGMYEDGWTAAARSAFSKVVADAAAKGVTITAAAGDNGSGDGAGDGNSHADFPAVDPNVVACGGTEIKSDSGTEVVWNIDPTSNATGGGVSRYYGVPTYQQGVAGLPVQADTHKAGRVIPDLAADASPRTGYNVVVDGSEYVIGGTSAVAPLAAALFARVNQRTGTRAGAPHAKLYAAGQLKDVTSGDNGAYKASAGFDACTGLGALDGAKVLAAMGVTQPAPPPPDPTPPPTPDPTPPPPTVPDAVRDWWDAVEHWVVDERHSGDTRRAAKAARELAQSYGLL